MLRRLLALKRSEETPKVRLVHVIIDLVTAHKKVEVIRARRRWRLESGARSIRESREVARSLYISRREEQHISLHPHHPSQLLPTSSKSTHLDRFILLEIYQRKCPLKERTVSSSVVSSNIPHAHTHPSRCVTDLFFPPVSLQ